MSYDDDQRTNCGGIRVAKSTLCADCLVALCEREKREREVMEIKIEKLKETIKRQNEMLDETLKYGFRRNQENARLHQEIENLHQEIEDYNI